MKAYRYAWRHNGRDYEENAVDTCHQNLIITYNPDTKPRYYGITARDSAASIAGPFRTIKQARAVAGALSGLGIDWSNEGAPRGKDAAVALWGVTLYAWLIDIHRGSL